jgi:CAAX protease family protein
MFAPSIIFRALPFFVYISFLALNDLILQMLAPASVDVRWLYAFRVSAVALLLIFFWQQYAELHKAKPIKLNAYILSILIGVLVFLIWILPYPAWASTTDTLGYVPTRTDNNKLDFTFVTIRLVGAALVVPMMEELFWRSFIMRWIQNPNFLQVKPALVSHFAFITTAILFALEHHLWLAGLIAGLAYGWLYQRQGNLWMPIIAHMVTNAMLGIWVIYTKNWQYW